MEKEKQPSQLDWLLRGHAPVNGLF